MPTGGFRAMLEGMRRHLVLCLLALAALRIAPVAADGQSPGAADPATCTEIRGEVRYENVGYTHLVTVKNGCSRAVMCTVWTRTDPKKQKLHARAGETRSVVIRRGSPAREVKAEGSCEYVK